KKLGPGALRALFDYAWPGNVRELLNEVRRAALLADGDVIGRSDLSPRVLGREREVDAGSAVRSRAALRATVRRAERGVLESVLKAVGGNQSEAARRLGL